MTLSTKDTLEPAAIGTKSSPVASSGAGRPETSGMRADAVSLDVPVKVHGSRVTDVVLGTTPHTEPFEEETSTMIVFPQGGVLRMATVVNIGQMLVLTNQKTKQDAICRVVKVRPYSKGQSYAEVEFTHRQVGFWGVHFSADNDELAAIPPPAPTPQPAASNVTSNVTGRPTPPVVSSVSMRVQDIPSIPSPAQPESAFASIGSQEEIQPAASITTPKPVTRSDIAPSSSATARPSRSFGTLTGGAVSSSSNAEMGTRLGSGFTEAPSQTPSAGGKGLMIASCVAFLMVGLAIGSWYFRQHPASSSPVSQAQPSSVANTTTNSNITPQPSAMETQNLPVSASQPAASSIEIPAPVAPAVGVNSQRLAHNSAGSIETVPHEISEPAAREQKTAPMGNIGLAVIGGHPVTKRNSNKVAAAPEIAPAASAPAITFPGAISASTPNLPPPPSLQRVKVGGLLVPAKVLSSTPPVYPASVRAAGIAGDVVITAQIDETGKVTGMQVVSGLAALRQAALDALKNWKYQPATLNGEPVASQANVTIQFRK